MDFKPSRMSDHPPGIAVFCGANAGNHPAFRRDAEAIGRGIADRGWRLVFGGGCTGLMGAAATAASAAEGDLLGVVPVGVFESGVPRGAAHIVSAPNLRERKALIRANAEACVALPGGIGTLDEAIETAVERQLGRHRKPLVLVNTLDYWRPLLAILDRMREFGFLATNVFDLMVVANDGADALEQLDRMLGAAPNP